MSFDNLDNFLIMKIMEFLPLKERILCKNVCHRWASLHELCNQNIISLFLNENFLIQNRLNYGYNRLYGDKILHKILLLTGKKLKKLVIDECDATVSLTLFSIIGQLCPKIDHFEIKDASNIVFDNVKDLEPCTYLKSFVAENAHELEDWQLEDLLLTLPNIKKISITDAPYLSGGEFVLELCKN